MWRFLLPLVCLIWLTACTDRIGLPAPVVFKSTAPVYSVPPVAAKPAAAPVPRVTSAPVPAHLPAPAKAADLQPASPRDAMQVTIKPGDTVYAIARAYQVNPKTLILDNRLSAPYQLHPGQKLWVPAQKTYPVKPGDTLYSIARNHNLSVKDLADVNRLQPPYALAPGDRILLTAATAGTAPSPRSAPAVIPASYEPPPSRSVEAKAGKGFSWPVQGRLISTFGPKSGGLYNNGINILAQRGAPVKAARNGRVVYAGKDLKSYGNLILIQHEDDYITAYAHLDRIDTQRGDTVRQGQTIATVGSTGSANRPQLHFEIRRKRSAVDPLPYLVRT